MIKNFRLRRFSSFKFSYAFEGNINVTDTIDWILENEQGRIKTEMPLIL